MHFAGESIGFARNNEQNRCFPTFSSSTSGFNQLLVPPTAAKSPMAHNIPPRQKNWKMKEAKYKRCVIQVNGYSRNYAA